MSHVTAVKVIIKDLEALKAACARLDTVEFRENKTFFNWWGSNVGDYREGGVDPTLNGRCDHTIAVKGSSRLMTADRSQPYEVGVCKNADGTFTLKMDFFAGGKGIVKAVGGNQCELLTQAYTFEVEKRAMQKNLAKLGFGIVERKAENGALQLVATRQTGGSSPL